MMRHIKKPRILNRICANPIIITCVIGACALNGLIFRGLAIDAPLRDIVADWRWALYILLLFIPAAAALGCLLGTMLIGRLICSICSRINGAPLRAGDRVIILSGQHKGITATVWGITNGQGGEEIAWVEFSTDKGRFHEIFEEYSLLRVGRSERRDAVNEIAQGESLGINVRTVNKVCSHPFLVVCASIACVSGLLLTVWLLCRQPLRTIGPVFPGFFFIVVLFIVFLVGVMSLLVCVRTNGGPLKPGDRVLILSGGYQGYVAEVKNLVLQNRGLLALVDIGDSTLAFDRWSLLKIDQSEQLSSDPPGVDRED